ncbi:MAG: hypothetical protein ACPF8V_10090 [Luteibaculum sp.]
MQRIKITILPILLIIFGFKVQGQLRIPGFVKTTTTWDKQQFPVYQYNAPPMEDLGKEWDKFLKDAADIKLSEKKGRWISDPFTIPESNHKGQIFSWFKKLEDSVQVQITLSLGDAGFSSDSGMVFEEAYILALIKEFDYQTRKEYFEARLDALRDKRKDLKKSIKNIERDINSNQKEIDNSEREARKNPDSKNELLGKAKDLANENKELEQKLMEKKKELTSVEKSLSSLGNDKKVLEALNPRKK